jgi:hypothetical protein
MSNNVPIIVYIHICQKLAWKKSFDRIFNVIKSSGLYHACIEIRVCVVNDKGILEVNNRFYDPKIKIKKVGNSELYERITLNHMRNQSENEDVQYCYLHTKGIKHIDGPDKNMEQCVKDWIDLMLYWNVLKWNIASSKLFENDIYGCDYSTWPSNHFSGNFWWANSCYIRTLPREIGPDYCDPEFWICKRENPKPLLCNIFSSGLDGGDHYFHRYIKGVNYGMN